MMVCCNYFTVLMLYCIQVIKLLLTYSESKGGYSDLYDALLTLMVTGVDDVSSTESLQSKILVSVCVHIYTYVCTCVCVRMYLCVICNIEYFPFPVCDGNSSLFYSLLGSAGTSSTIWEIPTITS